MITIAEIKKWLETQSDEAVFKKHLSLIDKKNPETNAFLSICEFKENKNQGRLNGIPVAIKDSLTLRGIDFCQRDGKPTPTTVASKMLENWIAPYNATACQRLIDAGATILGKTNTDEFTMGGSTENSAFGPSKNPHDLTRVPGGSSGGSASAVASGMCAVALGTDTGGSIRQPASYCGIVGVKPTYGLVSRYGLVAHGSSFDTVGPMTSCVIDSAEVLEIIAGRDEYDMNTSDRPVGQYISACKRGVKGMKIGLPKEMLGEGVDDEVRQAVLDVANKLKDRGAIIQEVSLPYAKYGLAVYYVLIPAEVSANMARYDGLRFGEREEGANFQETFTNTRSKYLGKEVKRRIAVGTFVLSSGYQDAYYNKAVKVRELIKQDFNKVFQHCDVLISPVAPSVAFKFGANTSNPLKMYMEDMLTVPASCAQIPAGSVHFTLSREEAMPIGIQVMANMFEEEKMFAVMGEIELIR